MKLHLLTGALALAFASLATAQTYTTSPAGFENTVGPSAGVRPFFGAAYHFQAVDNTLAGTAINNIVALNYRRDESATTASGAVTRTADVTVIMGHGDVQQFQNVWANNYTSASTTVYTKKSLNLPDLTAQTAGGNPEPWTMRIPFDTAFNYNGVDDLVYETVYENTSATTSYSLDRSGSTSSLYQLTFGSSIGSGCTATGQSAPFSLTSICYSHNGSKLMRFGYQAANAPASQDTLLNLSFNQSSITLPGLCGTIIATPDISAPLGKADSTGAIGRAYFAFPYIPSLITGHLFAQAVALDPGAAGIPVALSQGADLQWPSAGTPTSTYTFIYKSDVTSPAGDGPITSIGPIIAGLEQ